MTVTGSEPASRLYGLLLRTHEDCLVIPGGLGEFEKAIENGIDMAIIDLGMPVPECMALLEQMGLEIRNAGMPVVIAGTEKDGMPDQYQMPGSWECIEKPFLTEEFHSVFGRKLALVQAELNVDTCV
ncbi:MAG: hypothetical protein M0Z59_00490 [Nitrospiraceae bacterium]|nr:hypothetical protein [Nitrospiraceae bacterium]